MPRGGINKHLVVNARAKLLAKGIHPSIDAVRKELGDTGSKTTIHRYLKEIEEKEGLQIADEALLSNTLKSLVSKMASQLKQEATDIVDKERQKHEEFQNKLKNSVNEKNAELIMANDEIKELSGKLTELNSSHSSLQSTLSAQQVENERLKQQLQDQQDLLENQKAYIESLEEKHLHARDSLEHYRSSVKEQREQDTRAHEQGIQLLQVEIRELRQSISIKQSEITHLNSDNAQLITKVSDANKQIHRLEKDKADIQKLLDSTSKTLANREALLGVERRKAHQLKDDNTALEDAVSSLNRDLHHREIELASLKSDLSAKNSLFDQLIVQVKSLSQTSETGKT